MPRNPVEEITCDLETKGKIKHFAKKLGVSMKYVLALVFRHITYEACIKMIDEERKGK